MPESGFHTQRVGAKLVRCKEGRVTDEGVSEDELTVFELIGGQPTIDRLVEAFYRNMDTLQEAKALRAMHATDLRPITQLLKRYLGEWLGGPPEYSTRRGHPMLRARHFPFNIGIAERDEWMLCMQLALDETIPDAEIRTEIGQALARLADHMRNQPVV